MTEPKRPAGPHATIATRAELDQRIASRPIPEAGMHLTPDTSLASDVNRQIIKLHEDRIKALEDRLQNARTTVRSGISYAKLNDKARTDFDRSR